MTEKTNFLVIMSDQHSPEAIGALRHPVVKTPALDALAASGVSFTSAYCAYPMCTPARASFMTGLLTPQHGVWDLGSPLSSGLPTWAHALRAAGYRTTISGRMHFIGPDQMHGFERRVCPGVTAEKTPFTEGEWEQPLSREHKMLQPIADAGPTDERTRAEIYDDGVLEASLQELRRFAGSPSDHPWTLMVGFILPHFPFAISRGHYDLYEGLDIPMPRTPPDGGSFEEHVPEQMAGNRRRLGLTSDGAADEDVRMARRCYYAMVTRVDEMVGRLTSELQRLGLARNTWVVYLSDHGESLGEHGFWSKGTFWEESVRVPLIVARPGERNAGAHCAAPVSQVDWLPTVLDVIGQEWCEPMPGRSLVPLLDDPGQTWADRAVLSDYACQGTRALMRMVRKGNYKACFAPGFPPTLFDLEADPHEWNDLCHSRDHRTVLAELEQDAGADGWDPVRLKPEIKTLKRRLNRIAAAERKD